jgi:hypothetical protein
MLCRLKLTHVSPLTTATTTQPPSVRTSIESSIIVVHNIRIIGNGTVTALRVIIFLLVSVLTVPEKLMG